MPILCQAVYACVCLLNNIRTLRAHYQRPNLLYCTEHIKRGVKAYDVTTPRRLPSSNVYYMLTNSYIQANIFRKYI